MGHFLTVSAYRGVEVAALSKAIAAALRSFEALEEEKPSADYDPRRDACIFAPENGWTVVLWPEHFVSSDETVNSFLSEQLGAVVSTVHVVDDDYWTHILIDSGRVLDRFCSAPAAWAQDPESAARLRERWKGDASVVAAALGVDEQGIRGYFVEPPGPPIPAPEPPRSILSKLLGGGRASEPVKPAPKVHPDDEYPLDDFWVFTDLWRRMGILYPDDMAGFARRIRLVEDFDGRLPAAAESEP